MEPLANVANWSWQLLSWACISPQHYKQLLPTSQSWSRWPNIIPKFNYVKFELSQLSAHICMVGSQLSSCLAETKQSSTTWPFCFTVCVLLLGIVNEFPSVINLTHAYKCPFRSTQRTESPALNNRKHADSRSLSITAHLWLDTLCQNALWNQRFSCTLLFFWKMNLAV